MTEVGKPAVVLDDAEVIGLLDHHTGHAALCQQRLKALPRGDAVDGSNHLQFDVVEVGVGLDDGKRLGVDGFRDEHLALLLTGGHRHHHGLGRCGRTVIHRGVRDVHARQLGHHRLILKDIVQRALRDLGLIRRVRGQQLRALQQIGNDRRRVVVVDAATGEAHERLVLLAELLEELAHLQFAHLRRQLIVAAEADVFRNLGV